MAKQVCANVLQSFEDKARKHEAAFRDMRGEIDRKCSEAATTALIEVRERKNQYIEALTSTRDQAVMDIGALIKKLQK